MVAKLSEILTFVSDQGAHIVVLPEYVVPSSGLETLVGFSRECVIVAGMGVLRNADEAAAVATRAADTVSGDLVGRNTSILVEHERVHLITKRVPAEGEVITEGVGPRVIDTVVSGRDVRVGVAVCLDYLRYEEELRDQGADCVCIPAFSANVDEFTPLAPRDYVRLFANCSAFGGSSVFASGLSSPAFATDIGVRPLPRGTEGVIIVDFEGPLTRPSALRPPRNAVVARAAVIERGVDNGVAMDVVRQLGEIVGRLDLSVGGLPPVGNSLGEQSTRWLEHLDASTAILRDAVIELRRAAAQEIDDNVLYGILGRHLTIAAGGSTTSIRAKQARFVKQRIGQLISSNLEVPSAGAALDAYSEVTGREPSAAGTVHHHSGNTWRFALRLGQYDAENAARTLPRQLSVLQAMAGMPPGSLKITYRLHSERDPRGPDLVTFFDVLVEGDAAVVESDQAEAMLRSMLVESWDLGGSDQEPRRELAAYTLQLVPSLSGRRRMVAEDWSAIVDILRTHGEPIAVDMSIEALDAALIQAPLESAEEELDQWLSRLSALPFVNAGDEAERRSNAYFAVLSELARSERRSLGLRFTVTSEVAVPALLVGTIASELFGHLPFDASPVRTLDDIGPVAVSPSEAIAVFHPPYGRIQGRGLPDGPMSDSPYVGEPFPPGGTTLGTARVAGPREDRTVDVVIDESGRARHLYVIGRTGTGKTNLLKELCRQDIATGRGLAVLDPHGDLVDYLAMHCDERREETVLLDFGRSDVVPLFNPLTVDMGDARAAMLHVTDFLGVLESRYYSEYTGPVFNDMMRQALETILDPAFPAPRSIGLIEGMYRNSQIRRLVTMATRRDSVLRDRWKLFESMPEKEKAERVVWMLAKFADLMPPDSPLRLSLCATERSPLSLQQIVWDQGVLLIKIPEAAVGPDASAFLGALLLRRIQRAIFDCERATGRAPSDRPVFTLYVDEFQRYATAGVEALVAEARKFGCGLVLAHQNLDQLNAFSRFEGRRSAELLDAIVGNVSSIVAFRVGPRDAPTVAAMLGVSATALDSVPKFRALCRTTIDYEQTEAFTLSVPDAGRLRGTPAAAERLRERMQQDGYWIKAETAAQNVDGQLSQLEQVLSEHQDGVADESRAAAVALQERLSSAEAPGEVVADALGEDLIFKYWHAIVTALVEHYLAVPASTQVEVADLVLTHMLVSDGGELATGNTDSDLLGRRIHQAIGPGMPADQVPRLVTAIDELGTALSDVGDLGDVQHVAMSLGHAVLTALGGRGLTDEDRDDVVKRALRGERVEEIVALVGNRRDDVRESVRSFAELYSRLVAMNPWWAGESRTPAQRREDGPDSAIHAADNEPPAEANPRGDARVRWIPWS